MFEQFYTEPLDLTPFIGLKVYARCQTCHNNGRGTKVFYGTMSKHRVLNLFRLIEGERTAGWFNQDDIIEVSSRPL